MSAKQSKPFKDKKLKCLTCGYRTRDRNLLHNHFDTHFYHPMIPVVHRCIYCNRFFGSINELHRHAQSAGHIKVVSKWSQGLFDLSTMVLFKDASLESVAASFAHDSTNFYARYTNQYESIYGKIALDTN